MNRSIFLAAVGACWLTANVAFGASCLEHRWYRPAGVAEHWALLEHRLESIHYKPVTKRDKASMAIALLERQAARELPIEFAKELIEQLPQKTAAEQYFLVRGIGYSAPNGQIYVYVYKKSVMVGYSYLGPIEHLPTIEIPLVVALPFAPDNVYTGCSGAS